MCERILRLPPLGGEDSGGGKPRVHAIGHGLFHLQATGRYRSDHLGFSFLQLHRIAIVRAFSHGPNHGDLVVPQHIPTNESAATIDIARKSARNPNRTAGIPLNRTAWPSG